MRHFAIDFFAILILRSLPILIMFFGPGLDAYNCGKRGKACRDYRCSRGDEADSSLLNYKADQRYGE